MDFHDQVPVELAHFLEAHITQDASVVDHDVDGAESIDSSLDNLVTEFDGVLVGDCNTTLGLDLIDNGICGVLGGGLILTLNGTTEVIDDDLAAARSEHESVLTAKTVSSTGHDCDLSIEANITHSD